jgi:hypothetical protein
MHGSRAGQQPGGYQAAENLLSVGATMAPLPAMPMPASVSQARYLPNS